MFGASPLTKFVGDMNRALGYADAGGVNLFRHMRVSTFMKGNPTFEEREALAEEMGHSLITQTAYTRNIIITEDKA